jgi:hypothetical protein
VPQTRKGRADRDRLNEHRDGRWSVASGNCREHHLCRSGNERLAMGDFRTHAADELAARLALFTFAASVLLRLSARYFLGASFSRHADLQARDQPRHGSVSDAKPRPDRPAAAARTGAATRSQGQESRERLSDRAHLCSPDGSRDQLYLSNYATLHIKDAIAA